ncbi:MAG TPA: cell division protein CrgA [Actinomycetota bacterium]|jgi:hypothetical protein|nr:cell division protein CrgA [Actinomycetota bacterium]
MPKSRSKRVRRQPPPKVKPKQSPAWFGPLFFVLLLGGATVIVTNYLGLYGGQTQGYLLWVGLGLIAVAFILATQWH